MIDKLFACMSTINFLNLNTAVIMKDILNHISGGGDREITSK